MNDGLHTVRFPGETDEYRRARNELLEAEIELRRQDRSSRGTPAQPAARRRGADRLPASRNPRATRAKRGRFACPSSSRTARTPSSSTASCFVPGSAGLPLEVACPSCTSIIDAVDGEAPHITQRVNLAVAAKVPIQQLREHARSRGWRNVRLLSSANTTYNHDYHAEAPDGSQNPIATVFVRRDGKIHHFWSSELYFAPTDPGQHPRHVDFIWPLWAVLDRTPEGRGSDWGTATRLRLAQVPTATVVARPWPAGARDLSAGPGHASGARPRPPAINGSSSQRC